jgi:hypothetical protein
MHVARLLVVACLASTAGCAHAIVTRPTAAVAPTKPAPDALLVLPGFGYDRAGERAFRSLAPSMAAEGIDLYLPTYVSRGGLETSRDRLRRFVRDHRLARYQRVHVFAFIAGAWTFNPLAETDVLPNLSTVVYDRSPYQERAPRIAVERLRFLTWVRHGRVVGDVAKTRYAPLTTPAIRVGLVVETQPTSFIRRYATAADRQGPYRFDCDGFGQRYDDCLFVAMSHDQLYARFAEVWPEVRAFMRTGQFTPSADRSPPTAMLKEDAS